MSRTQESGERSDCWGQYTLPPASQSFVRRRTATALLAYAGNRPENDNGGRIMTITLLHGQRARRGRHHRVLSRPIAVVRWSEDKSEHTSLINLTPQHAHIRKAPKVHKPQPSVISGGSNGYSCFHYLPASR